MSTLHSCEGAAGDSWARSGLCTSEFVPVFIEAERHCVRVHISDMRLRVAAHLSGVRWPVDPAGSPVGVSRCDEKQAREQNGGTLVGSESGAVLVGERESPESTRRQISGLPRDG